MWSERSNDRVLSLLYARHEVIASSFNHCHVNLSLKFDRLHLTFLGHKPQKDLTKQLFWGLRGAFFAIAFIPAFPLSLIASQLCKDIRLILQDILIGPNTILHNLGRVFAMPMGPITKVYLLTLLTMKHWITDYFCFVLRISAYSLENDYFMK